MELVNRFLGDYIEGLNKDQLSVSIWGGVSANCIGLVTIMIPCSGTDRFTRPMSHLQFCRDFIARHSCSCSCHDVAHTATLSRKQELTNQHLVHSGDRVV